MALRDWFSRQSPLQRALKRGMAEGGDLSDEIHALEDYSLKSKADAEAVCDVLDQFSAKKLSDDDRSALHSLIGLFQDVEDRDCPAYEVMAEKGILLLVKITQDLLNAGEGEEENPDDEDLILFALKIMAMYGTSEGADMVLAAAQKPLNSDAYMWSVILGMYTKGHPHAQRLFESLSDPLPTGFLAMALLDAVNAAKIDGAEFPHPFDAPEGYKQLENWLTDPDESHFSYAISTAAALPFITAPARDALLAIAFDHPSPDVQIEAAWASAKLGGEAGIKWLARSCCDVNLSDKAKRYLQELGREDAIPGEASDRDFAAKAEFAQWLAHPNELGKAPDELEIVDHRELAWPPSREMKPLWLIRYVLRDRTGLEEDNIDCGLVGSVTWCFFNRKMHQRPPEDAYAIHCYWEVQHTKWLSETEVTDPSEYASILRQWNGESLESPVITHVCETTLPLEKPGRVTAVATAKKAGQEGWVVLDGDRSAWYPKEEQPEETSGDVVLSMHVGRRLLGFEGQPDRKAFLIPDTPKIEPHQFIAAYEKLLLDIPGASPERQKDLLGSFNILSNKYSTYVDALAAVRRCDKSETLIEVFERFLAIAQQTDPSVRDEVLDSHLLMENFQTYVEQMIAKDRGAAVLERVDQFRPLWKHNLGYGLLGSAAFKAGRDDVAEPFFIQLREGLKDHHRSEEMSMLAEIWHRRGEIENSRRLLIDCMQKLIEEIKTSKYNSDRKMHAEQFAYHRATYLRLFPEGARELAEQGIPENPLTSTWSQDQLAD
jgi:hypothetical protein